MANASVHPFPSVEQTFQVLGLGEPDDAWRQAWPISQATFDSTHLFFLDPAYLSETCRWLCMGDDTTEACLCGLRPFHGNESLQRFAWHFHFSWFKSTEDLPATSSPWIPDSVGEEAALFYAIVFLSGVPTIQRIHRKHNIPESITLDTLSDLERWIRKHRQRHRKWGFSETFWLRLHFSGKLFALGRLQFELGRFPLDYHVYRNRRTHRILVLAPDGMRFRPDGQCAGADDPTAWSAHLESNDQTVSGMIISPLGAAQSEPLELPLSEWQPVLHKGDPALSIHIPEAGPMDHAACGESVRRAMEFFPAHLPEFAFRAFMCFSWLMDRQFEDYLVSSSNIVRFLQEFYLVPVPFFNPVQSFPHIFDGYTGDLEQAPQRTSLQRATLRHLKAGGEWRVGGGILFREDLDWGKQVYRSR